MTQYNITMSSQSSSITSPLHMTESVAFNLYVRESMLPSNKENCWIVAYDDMKIPVVSVMKDSEFISKFKGLTEPYLSSKRINQLTDLMLRMDSVNTVNSIFELSQVDL